MKILALIVAFLVGVVGICAVVGATLPKNHTVAMRATIAAPQIRVWSTLTDPSQYTTWRTGLKSVEVTARSPLAWKEVSSMGPMNLSVSEFQPPARMVADITDKDQPFGGSWEYVVRPDSTDSNKSVVTITEDGWVSNPLFRFYSHFVMGESSSIDAYLRQLSKKFGAEATPEKVVIKTEPSAD